MLYSKAIFCLKAFYGKKLTLSTYSLHIKQTALHTTLIPLDEQINMINNFLLHSIKNNVIWDSINGLKLNTNMSFYLVGIVIAVGNGKY